MSNNSERFNITQKEEKLILSNGSEQIEVDGFAFFDYIYGEGKDALYHSLVDITLGIAHRKGGQHEKGCGLSLHKKDEGIGREFCLDVEEALRVAKGHNDNYFCVWSEMDTELLPDAFAYCREK